MPMTALPWFPLPVLGLTAASILICLPMVALSIVNYGMLSIWLNASVAFLILIHHITLFSVSWITRNRVSSRKIIIDDNESSPLTTELEPPVAFSMTNVVALSFLFLLLAIAFSIMVDITTRGALASTLPAERIGSHKWNIHVEIAQTSVLGAEFLVLGSLIGYCGMGLKRVIDEKEARQEEIEYGMASPV